MIKKVAVIGPESTGKSTLCRRLATHYQTLWVPEYAREYLETHGKSYTYDSLLEIAKGQVALEEDYLGKLKVESQKSKPGAKKKRQTTNHKQQTILFIDTEMYVMKVWSEFVFGKCHQWVIDQVVERQYHLYLLCDVDLPWAFDELREYPAAEPRQQLFRMYHDILVNQSTPWAVISGDNPERVTEAIKAIQRIL